VGTVYKTACCGIHGTWGFSGRCALLEPTSVRGRPAELMSVAFVLSRWMATDGKDQRGRLAHAAIPTQRAGNIGACRRMACAAGGCLRCW